ncbi:hypothetical protein EUTSA_v10009758mg [Eutrema salsugineum]|uniref:DUF7787 domain-containing protein n=2 Tax=Eutrema salsugineum TaxID=72664 RepID=V4L939_EUTSA|nr:hypothetical protein EUTSA_v10009758mg [Eutrema salsugineum]
MRPGVEKKISLEEYVDFFNSGKSIDFTIAYLNQIVHMHGFRKLHKSAKKIVGEAVDALDLLDLSRSTLKQTGVSSSATQTLDEVITDIEALKWQECCLTSLQIINFDEVTRAGAAKPKQKSNKRKIGKEKAKKIKKKKKKNSKSISDL